MFIRDVQTRAPKTGKVYTAYRLVASRSTEKGPRQHTVMSLPGLTLPREKWPQLAHVLENRLAGQELCFAIPDPEVMKAADEAMHNYRFVQSRQKEFDTRKDGEDLQTLDVNSMGHGTSRSLGPELVACAVWDRLGFDRLLRDCGLSDREMHLAKAIILARVIHPDSELETWRWLRDNSSLPELIDEGDLADIGKDPLYRIADILLEHKAAIERALYERQRELQGRPARVFLYDLTNTYFEGRCAGNPLAKRGDSKEKRSKCPLVSLALVVDEDGLPVFSQVYGGNQAESKTLPEILDTVAPKDRPMFAVAPTIIMDRGIATKANLQLIRERELPYAIIERRDRTEDFLEEFRQTGQGFEVLLDSAGQRVLVKKVLPEDKSAPAVLLCLSEARREKERAIGALLGSRFDKAVGKLQAAVAKGSITIETVERRIGRIQQRYPSVAGHFTLRVIKGKDGVASAVQCEPKASGVDKADSHGCYVIETSHRDMPATEIWHLYMTLTRVEGAFRALKSDLGLRPVYHQGPERTRGHLFISVLAYHILAAIEAELQAKGDTRRWSTIRKVLDSYRRATLVYCDSEDQIWHHRSSAIPEAHHKAIFNRLGIRDFLETKRAVVGKRVR